MGTHYICTGGCGGTSEVAGAICQTENCSNNGKPMKECDCIDGFHKQGTQQDPDEGGSDM